MSADINIFQWATLALLGGGALLSALVAVYSLGSALGDTTFPFVAGVAVVAVVLGLLHAIRPSSRRRESCEQGAIVADPQKNEYPVGTKIVMGFRRQGFVWTEKHIPGHIVAAWEHRTDVADALFKPGMTAREFEAAVTELSHPPAWVDWELLDEGCRFLVQVWPMAVYSLGWALLGGFGAESASAVLLRSRYWAVKGDSGRTDTWKRLLESQCFVYDVGAHGAAGYRPGGEAWKACLHVRYLHCRTRASLSSSWDREKFGEPINQTQVAGTLLGTSVLLLQGIEELLGMSLCSRKKEAFTHLWRVVGFLFGIDDDFNPNACGYERALINMESLFSRGIPAFPDPALTKVLTQHICESVAQGVREDWGVPLSAGIVASSAWHFLGETYGAAVGLPASPLRARCLARCRMLVMRAVFSWYFLPGAPWVFERLMRYSWERTVAVIRKRQPQCRFGVCPLKPHGAACPRAKQG